MSDAAEPSGPAETFTCPHCEQAVEGTAGDVAQLVECPACHESFVIPSRQGSFELPSGPEDPGDAGGAQDDDELDAVRMRHVVVQRRAAIRSRSYALIGAGACLIGGIQLCIMAYHEVRAAGWGMRPGSFLLFALATAIGVLYFLGRAAYWQRESAGSAIPDPTTPPDFSSLSDGSQHARNLEALMPAEAQKKEPPLGKGDSRPGRTLLS
ncbi:MAG TPA: hypothetical protein VH475_06895 [Tepidisphaeraceae bacterium]|jgi:hypothetical protein